MAVNDEYKCVSMNFRDGVLYKPGDKMLLPAGSEYKGKSFVLVKKAEKPEKKTSKKKKEESSEDEG
jgi:hypothetical protein